MNTTLSREEQPIPQDQVGYLISTAARAPSVHNTQPWRFHVNPRDIELFADPGRKLHGDPLGREMLVSCGAALFGLRLAIRSLGYQPVVTLLPDPARLRLLARVAVIQSAPMTAQESTLLNAIPHRHTHRGAFSPAPLPPGLLVRLQHDVLAEGATLALVQTSIDYERLASLLSVTGPTQDRSPVSRADVLRWSHPKARAGRDGVPGPAFPSHPGSESGRLRQRDFDLGRGIGFDVTSGRPAATAILLTLGDRRSDWLRAGQALQRLLLHAASEWVFASLYTQPLESASTRRLISERLGLPGHPQMVLQLGRADHTHPTSRRLAADLVD